MIYDTRNKSTCTFIKINKICRIFHSFVKLNKATVKIYAAIACSVLIIYYLGAAVFQGVCGGFWDRLSTMGCDIGRLPQIFSSLETHE
jgi:hypothetical protein